MKKIGLVISGVVALLVIIKAILVARDAPEKVLDILSHWAIAWAKGGLVVVLIGLIIFGINKWISKEKSMSIVGMCSLPIIIPGILIVVFGNITALIILGAIAGLIVGYFSYIIDDHLLDAWELRQITLPAFIGIGFGASVTIATIVENWQDEYIYVTEHATCTQVTIERYTYHYRSSKNGGSYYSWDTHDTKYFFDRGEKYPQPVAGTDYHLGTGAFGKTDRASFTNFKWIGGDKILRNGTNKGFKWILLDDITFVFKKDNLYEVEENYFGHAIMNGILKEDLYIYNEGLDASENIVLPTSKDVPGAITLFYEFFHIMATNPDFALLRWIYVLLYLPLIIGAIFIQELRLSLWVFLGASTIIMLIVLAILARRSGSSLSDYASKSRFNGFGGGRFGGGGSRGNW
jgi:uncharacterized membrane protein YgcG